MNVDRLLDEAFERMLAARGVQTLGSTACGHSVAESQALISWRLLLFHSLVAEGWRPPPGVFDRMAADEELLWLQDDDEYLEGLPTAPSLDEDRAVVRATGDAVRTDAAVTREWSRVVRAEARAERERCETRRVRALQRQVSELQESLETRGVVERARGMLMLRHGCGEEEAFHLLVRTAHHGRLTLREAADAIIETATGAAEAGRAAAH